jgi:tungstate transport system ATP-binding protein
VENILQLRNIRHQYNGRTVLDIPALDIRCGSIIGLAGPNGSGKTTLLNIMALINKSSSGTVTLFGKKADLYNAADRLRIALLPQDSYLLRRSVYENITYGLKIRGQNGDLTAAVAVALNLVGLPASFASRLWHELSGGEAQRVSLAARLVLQPDCLLLDEPTASVDMNSEERIRQAVLAARRDHGTTLVIASHQRTWLADICDSLIHLYNGRILDCSADTVLVGPWEQTGGNLVGKRLADGQMIYASPPPHPASSAVITSETLVLKEHGLAEERYLLHGTVTGVYYEKHAAGPCVHVICGDHRLIAGTSKDIFRMDKCHPGTQVALRYHPQDITWLSD